MMRARPPVPPQHPMYPEGDPYANHQCESALWVWLLLIGCFIVLAISKLTGTGQ